MSFRGSWWPAYILLDSLPSAKRNDICNMAVPCIIVSHGVLGEREVDALLSRSKRAVDELNSDDIRVSDSLGRRWTLHFKIWSGVLDLDVSFLPSSTPPLVQAARKLLDAPRWTSIHGCHACEGAGETMGHGRYWTAASTRGARLRSRDDFMARAAPRPGIRSLPSSFSSHSFRFSSVLVDPLSGRHSCG